MMTIGLIGLGSGVASALLFASIASGSPLSIILFYLAPLPIMIAAIGWSHWAAAIAVACAALSLGFTLGWVFLFAFVVGTGFPAWWLGYLAMLARPTPGNAAEPLEWYPAGRLVIWAAALASLVIVVAIFNLGTDFDGFRNGLRQMLDRLIVIRTESPGTSNTERLVEFLISAIPPGAAVLATITNLLNLWLSARIVRYSGQMHRPWPDLTAMEFPPLAAAVLAGSIAASFLGGLVGIVAASLMAALLMAYGVLGFAVLHTVTRGMSSRPFALGGVYAAVIIFGWPVIALCLLGLLEAAFGIRRRFANKHGPPAAT